MDSKDIDKHIGKMIKICLYPSGAYETGKLYKLKKPFEHKSTLMNVLMEYSFVYYSSPSSFSWFVLDASDVHIREVMKANLGTLKDCDAFLEKVLADDPHSGGEWFQSMDDLIGVCGVPNTNNTDEGFKPECKWCKGWYLFGGYCKRNQPVFSLDCFEKAEGSIRF